MKIILRMVELFKNRNIYEIGLKLTKMKKLKYYISLRPNHVATKTKYVSLRPNHFVTKTKYVLIKTKYSTKNKGRCKLDL